MKTGGAANKPPPCVVRLALQESSAGPIYKDYKAEVTRRLEGVFYVIVNAVENEYVLGFAQTHQGLALDPPPFEKGGPKL